LNPDEILQKYHDHINPGLADLLQLGGLAAVDDKAEVPMFGMLAEIST